MMLITGFYVDADPRRQNELLECIRRNAANALIEQIHLVVEVPVDPDALLAAYPLLAGGNIHLVAHGRRATYQDLFGYANRQLAGQRVIIANADISFDRSLARLDGYDLSGKLVCLSRWDIQPDGSASFFDHAESQDAWLFQAPLREFRADFHLGVLRCDNRLAWEAERAGLELWNPSRSVRAYHLHLSQVRGDSARQWLPGPTRAVPAVALDAPWLWFVVPCMGRLDDVRRTMGLLLAQTRSNYVLVDYSCPDGAGAWARENHPDVLVTSVRGRARFRGAEARNRGAAAVDDDGILCFLDADVTVSNGFSEYVLAHLEPGTFLVADRPGPGFDSALACRKSDFDRVHGFDEVFQDWGEECADLRAALRCAGLVERNFPASMLSHAGQHDGAAARFCTLADLEAARVIHAAYRRAKAAMLQETGPDGVATPLLRELYAAIARRHSGASELTPDARCARVAFRESMGYTIAKLAAGVSSHTNDPRPFTTIPKPLDGLAFTQVVASVVSPVDVEFLSAGNLYVLVGNDWPGYQPATAWLQSIAVKADLPMLQTTLGTGFEVWSLTGEAGQRFVLPTQMMLAADQLVRQ